MGKFKDTIARGIASVARALAEQANNRLDNLPNSIVWKGEVLYYDLLPMSVDKEGYAYTVRYKGHSSDGGTMPDGTEYAAATKTAPIQWVALGPDVSGKREKIRAEDSEETAVSVPWNSTLTCANQPSALTVSLETPSEEDDTIARLIFKAGAGFSITHSAPAGYKVVWVNEPEWKDGAVYEIEYRCLWLSDSGDIIIRARCEEVGAKSWAYLIDEEV